MINNEVVHKKRERSFKNALLFLCESDTTYSSHLHATCVLVLNDPNDLRGICNRELVVQPNGHHGLHTFRLFHASPGLPIHVVGSELLCVQLHVVLVARAHKFVQRRNKRRKTLLSPVQAIIFYFVSFCNFFRDRRYGCDKKSHHKIAFILTV